MAVQSGVLFFDGRPTDDKCRKLAAGLDSLAPDGVSTVARDGIAMAFGASHVWTGEESCAQPIQSNGGLMMTWDGRLDNRNDLLLGLRGQARADIADAEIALAVFERWGIDGLRSLIGDWISQSGTAALMSCTWRAITWVCGRSISTPTAMP